METQFKEKYNESEEVFTFNFIPSFSRFTRTRTILTHIYLGLYLVYTWFIPGLATRHGSSGPRTGGLRIMRVNDP